MAKVPELIDAAEAFLEEIHRQLDGWQTDSWEPNYPGELPPPMAEGEREEGHMIDKVALSIAYDFFSIAPKHRTREQLAKHIEPLVYLVRQINWLSGFTGNVRPDAGHTRLIDDIVDKAWKITETVAEKEDVTFRKIPPVDWQCEAEAGEI